jgi:hypothetical protein
LRVQHNSIADGALGQTSNTVEEPGEQGVIKTQKKQPESRAALAKIKHQAFYAAGKRSCSWVVLMLKNQK